MKPKIFIDGREGTTGLQIYDRLSGRDDISLIHIDETLRKDASERKKLINSADLVFLCLPDDAARESVGLIENSTTRVIDASTAHRTARGWVYGLPELSAQQWESIAGARFVANPGCHATGFIISVYPLIKLGIMPLDYPLTCLSPTGYSGGGKSMIADYEERKTEGMFAPGLYGLSLNHKHLPEMVAVTGLKRTPIFCPFVDDYYKGMATTIAIHNDMLLSPMTAEAIRDVLAEYYAGQRYVSVAPELGIGTLYSNWGANTNNLEITVCGNAEQTTITARFDNLGKGASGAAVQNMEIMFNLEAKQ
ncbi:MAG: N-acetyl-gamma-glutamyl-phosphate reductase [Oscillospiraceae bacterium]|nr:N-acetyl-gamma-glutamyl-phosphate reductase [Oscillospiraceae bacterium]